MPPCPVIHEIDENPQFTFVSCPRERAEVALLAENRVLDTGPLKLAEELQPQPGNANQLVEWSVEEARRLQIRRLMSLTYEQAFFEKLGFEVVNKDTLPLKVWSDCVRCPKREGCDEIAMVRTLWDVPMIVMPTTAPTPKGVSIPVLAHEDD